MKKYLFDVCHYIDCLFSFVFIIAFLRWIFGYVDNLLIMYVSLAGVILWPNKKYWAKWLDIDLEEQK
ncbi:hypothetical protein [Veillonella sp. R32]|uniref:hypothetical protein n=1 Tax=Veillonella sp. R32 TaxID=2021312 RepID=UPI001389DBB5|nr:hypothetical protein [Veillonella sp. R32]KAF1680478.1 hypothetical protein VER_08565 [Veillonella sp. R32]